jgi:glutamate synthase (NADPH) small chain
MGKPSGFKEFERELPQPRAVPERVQDWREIYGEGAFPESLLVKQAARCMDCGVPFCQNGCPLGNLIPEWNDKVYKGRWQEALALLHRTNNFPEFTGRICPAPCEEACVLNLEQRPVTIRVIEETIIERGFEEGWVKPNFPKRRTGKKVAVVGSGPAGLAAAAQLNKAGHWVTVFERADRLGGLLTYGIPNYKLEKRIVDRRLTIMQAEGVVFQTKAHVGVNVHVDKMRQEFDAICLAGGAAKARDLNIPGRNLEGVHLAMEFLAQQSRVNMGETVEHQILAKDKQVIILGGGDTGADCLGTSIRQGAVSVHQFELLPKPPAERTLDMPWPYWPMILRTSSAHEEGGARDWSINTKAFSGEGGQVKKLHGIRLEWAPGADGKPSMREIPGSEFEMACDLCLLALGFVHPEHEGPVEQLGLKLDPRGNVATDADYQSSVPGVFAAGDMHRGQSLVVWAIAEGRGAARAIDAFLMGRSDL